MSRLGLALMSLIVPGLGLIRSGSLRLGLAFAALNLLFSSAVIVYFVYGPTLTFSSAVTILAFALAIFLISQVGASLVTFLKSEYQASSKLWWTRWYVIVAGFLIWFGVQELQINKIHKYYRSFFIPAVSMMPNLAVDDRIYVKMSDYGDVERGDIVIFKANGAEYVKRVVAKGEDRVAMAGGNLQINGKAVQSEPVKKQTSKTPCLNAFGQKTSQLAELFMEKLPDENGAHMVADCGLSASDDFPEIVVPVDHYFLLGDNRDFSADSRFEPPLGFGMIRKDAIIGKPLFFHWSRDSSRIGTRVNPK